MMKGLPLACDMFLVPAMASCRWTNFATHAPPTPLQQPHTHIPTLPCNSFLLPPRWLTPSLSSETLSPPSSTIAVCSRIYNTLKNHAMISQTVGGISLSIQRIQATGYVTHSFIFSCSSRLENERRRQAEETSRGDKQKFNKRLLACKYNLWTFRCLLAKTSSTLRHPSGNNLLWLFWHLLRRPQVRLSLFRRGRRSCT
jgi:hypothetical protein